MLIFYFFYSVFSHSKPRYTPYILGRRYSLTPAAYKYLDIGISIGLVSHVEIAIGDTRDNRIILSHATWKAFIDTREDIEQLLRFVITLSFLIIQDLNVEFCKLYDTYKVKLLLCGKCLYMPSTLLFMLDLEHCVEHIYLGLSQNVYNTSEKFKHFISHLRQECVTDKRGVNMLHNICDKSSFIKCELVAYVKIM